MSTDAGREALRKERERADAAESELKKIRTAGQSEHEKAIDDAKAETEKATAAKYENRIRRSEVRSALRVAGITNDKALDLAVSAPQFASLKVKDDDTVEGLDEAVKAFQKDTPELFSKPAGTGQPTRGTQPGSPTDRPKTMEEAIAAGMSRPI